MTLEKVNEWLDNEYGISYTELVNIKEYLCGVNEKLENEIDRLNKEVEKLTKYVHHIQQVITEDLISKIGDINDE